MDSMYSGRYQAGDGPPPYHPSTVKQWATQVLAYSSQYNDAGWSASQTLGEPKVYPNHGDIQGAWASSGWSSREFIEVGFELPVRISSLHIYETFNPGAVVKIKGRESSGPWTLLWQTEQPTRLTSSRIFSPPLLEASKMLKINHIRLDLDCSVANTWCEIDAVQLVGIRDGAVAPVDDTQYTADMSMLVNNKLYSDVKLKIGSKSVYGHRAILATRSPYFAKLLAKSSDEKEVVLKFPKQAGDELVAIIHFLYTNRISGDLKLSQLTALCQASFIIEVPELKTAVMYKLVEGIKCDNVVSLYEQVQSDPNMEEVKSLCMSYMASHLQDMSKEPSFERLPQSVIVSVVQQATLSLCLNDNNRS